MPIDEEGNRADVVMDPLATVNRMNIGRLYQQYINTAIRDTGKRINKILNTNSVSSDILLTYPDDVINYAYSYLLDFYKIINYKQYDFYKNQITNEEKYEHLANVVNNGIYLYYPIDNEKKAPVIVKEIEADERYKPLYGKVSYIGNSGNKIVTNSNVRIGWLYLMLLEKIADDWSAVSTGKLQHFGVLSSMTKAEKFSFPWRNTPVRFSGETESRIFVGYCGRSMMAELMDRSNNPITQRNIVWNILKADVPTNIEHVVDRKYIPLGSGKNLQLVKHMFVCGGFTLIYKSDDSTGVADGYI